MSSRIPGFYRFTPEIRLERVAMARDLPASYRETYTPGGGLPLDAASLMIENVIGTMSLPVGIGLNLLINGREYLVPMVVEEPSVVAAVSHMAKVTREAGGIEADTDPSCMIGQIQILQCPDLAAAARTLRENRDLLLERADALHPRLVERGGGAREIEVRELCYEEDGIREPMLVLHLIVDTLDAMGANIINTAVERLSPLVAELTGGVIGLRILSNLADRRLARARVRLPAEVLAGNGFTGEAVIDGIVAADHFAVADPYRAATHNKGVMNGVDAVALATGNDWRAIEAGAHAYAARSGQYGPLTRWRKASDGALIGTIEMPLQVGIVGGPIQIHPTIRANLHILGVRTARELAEVMVSVGLVQNLGALRALATEGIQRGHMSMHARNVAARAGIPNEWIADVVDQMVARQSITQSGAEEVFRDLKAHREQPPGPEHVLSIGRASGKVILLGEHAVVHGYPALASSLDRGVEVVCRRQSGPAQVDAPDLLTHGFIFDGSQSPLKVALRRAFEQVGAPQEGISLTVSGNLPPGKGIGSSAALSIASLRALSQAIGRTLSEDELLRMGHAIEQVFHGMPSGIDHTVAARGGVLKFMKGDPPSIKAVSCARPFQIVLLDSGEVGPTSVQIGKVLSLIGERPERGRAIFEEIEGLVEQGVLAMEAGDGPALAEAMNRNHALLRELEVSTDRLDHIVGLARAAGAAGAKLTGAGGGGMVLALCLEGTERLLATAAENGILAISAQVPAWEGE